MTEKESPSGLGKYDTKHLKKLPNESVDLLTHHLGISFTFPPDKIPLTFGNTLRMASRRPLRTLEFKRKLKKHKGVYGKDYHAFFIHKESSIFVDLHENMHGYIQTTNPDFIVVNDQFNFADTQFFAGRQVDSSIFEKMYAHTIFEEGLANWASITVLEKMIDQQKQQGKDWRYLLDSVLPEETIKTIDPAHPGLFRLKKHPPEKGQIDELTEKLDLIKKLTQGKNRSKKVRSLVVQAHTAIMSHVHKIGHYFLEQITQVLLQSGMTINEVITLLVANPPTTFAEIHDPDHYLKTKFSPNP